MLLIACPWCGDRDEPEFSYGGQAHVPYPADPEALDDEEWARYLFFRDNPAGPYAERWVHAAGCRRWFNAVRDTRTNEFTACYPVGSPRPDTPAAPGDAPSDGDASRGGGLGAGLGSGLGGDGGGGEAAGLRGPGRSGGVS